MENNFIKIGNLNLSVTQESMFLMFLCLDSADCCRTGETDISRFFRWISGGYRRFTAEYAAEAIGDSCIILSLKQIC